MSELSSHESAENRSFEKEGLDYQKMVRGEHTGIQDMQEWVMEKDDPEMLNAQKTVDANRSVIDALRAHPGAEAAAGHAKVALERAKRLLETIRIKRFDKRFHSKSIPIELRGALRRKAMLYADEILTGARNPRNTAIVFCDANGLKTANDLFGGHKAGDAYLGSIADVFLRGKTVRNLKSRGIDVSTASDGHGDEFFLLLSHSDPRQELDEAAIDGLLADLKEEVRNLATDSGYEQEFTFDYDRARALFVPDERKFEKMNDEEKNEVERQIGQMEGFVLPPTFAAGAAYLNDGIAHANRPEEKAADRRVDNATDRYSFLKNAVGGMFNAADVWSTELKKAAKAHWQQGLEEDGSPSERPEENKKLSLVLERGLNAKLQQSQRQHIEATTRHETFSRLTQTSLN